MNCWFKMVVNQLTKKAYIQASVGVDERCWWDSLHHYTTVSLLWLPDMKMVWANNFDRQIQCFFPPVLLPFIPAGFSHLLPWYYMIYFIILLVHRDSRDMSECRRKYGSAWDEYCRTVRYRIIPRVYWGTQRRTLRSWGLFWPKIMAVNAHKIPNMNGLTDWFVFLEPFLKPRILQKKKEVLDSGLKVLQFFEFFDGRKNDSHYIYGCFEELPF